MVGKDADKRTVLVGVALLLAGLGLLAVGLWMAWRLNLRVVSDFGVAQETPLEYPEIDPTLSERRQAVLRSVRDEFEQPQTGTYYAEGMVEPWCADFVSYVMREAGMPLANQHTGSWRIPGIYTLQEYFAGNGQWQNSGLPQPGDVVIYDKGLFGGHTNFVVGIDGNFIYTVGGNEGNMIMLRYIDYTNPKYGAVGFASID
jgi:hypothetical protein